MKVKAMEESMNMIEWVTFLSVDQNYLIDNLRVNFEWIFFEDGLLLSLELFTQKKFSSLWDQIEFKSEVLYLKFHLF